MNAPDPSSDGWVGGSSVPQRDDVFSGSDGNHHTTYLISYNELLTQDSQQLHAEKEHNCILWFNDLFMYYYRHDKQKEAIIYPGEFSPFFKEKAALGGIQTHDTAF